MSKSPRDGERSRRRPRKPSIVETWEPRTRVGRMVKEGSITSIEEIFAQNHKIDDVEIVDILVPGLEEEVLSTGRVQRQTDAGRKTMSVATAAVGNKNGLVGVGIGKDTGTGTAIRQAIVSAKLNLIPVKRGCGSWECNCSTNPHSIPYKLGGKCSSVRVELFPGPMGLGLVTGDAAKKVLRLAGIEDIWSKTRGNTRATTNYVIAVFEALKSSYSILHQAEWADM